MHNLRHLFLRHGVCRLLNRVLGPGLVFNGFHHCRTGPVSLAPSLRYGF